MHSIRVIPCLDVDAGRVVKGIRYVDHFDAGDPVELAARYDAEGADELAFLDITASHEERDTMVEVVARTAEQVFIPLTVGGGVRSVEDGRRLLRAGADPPQRQPRASRAVQWRRQSRPSGIDAPTVPRNQGNRRADTARPGAEAVTPSCLASPRFPDRGGRGRRFQSV